MYKVIIVGAGPAGIFAALTLVNAGVDKVLLLEQGNGIEKRNHGAGEDILCGWGGAGAYSDGKLTLSTDIGGVLKEYVSDRDLFELLQTTDGIYAAYGAPDRIFGRRTPQIDALVDRAKLVDLEFIPTSIRHIGTENCRTVLGNFRDYLSSKIEIRTNCKVERIMAQAREFWVVLDNGSILTSQFVIAAPGRSGAQWMKIQAATLGLKTQATSVDIGVRVELPAVILKEITDVAYESKLVYYSKTFDEKVRTFCMNPYGEVVTEENNGIITVNGHSYANEKTENTNFAILVSSAFTEPFDDPIAYGRYIAQLANLLGKGPIVQRFGDLMAGRRSTPEKIAKGLTRPTLTTATPGDLSFVFPYRHLLSIIEMLGALEKLAPGVCSRYTLLYGVEVKFYSNRIEVTPEMETGVKNLFAIGDGAGISRGLLQASASGILAAKAVAKRVK